VERLKNYQILKLLKKRFANAKPKGVNMDDYESNNKKRSCPKVSKDWQASDKLPSTPSEAACECIFATLECVVNDRGMLKENGEAVGKIIGSACGDGLCDDIAMDTSNGDYGYFSFCDTTVRNSIVFSAAVKKGAKCDFNGFAEKAKVSGKDSKESCAKKAANYKSAPKSSKPKGFSEGADKSRKGESKDVEDSDSNSDSNISSKSKSKADSNQSIATNPHNSLVFFAVTILIYFFQ